MTSGIRATIERTFLPSHALWLLSAIFLLNHPAALLSLFFFFYNINTFLFFFFKIYYSLFFFLSVWFHRHCGWYWFHKCHSFIPISSQTHKTLPKGKRIKTRMSWDEGIILLSRVKRRRSTREMNQNFFSCLIRMACCTTCGWKQQNNWSWMNSKWFYFFYSDWLNRTKKTDNNVHTEREFFFFSFKNQK